MPRLLRPLALLLAVTGCPPAPPPADPADDPGPAAPEPATADTASGTADATEPTAPAPDATTAPGEATAPTTTSAETTAVEPAGNAGRLLAAADCFPRVVAALQAEPRPDEPLETFLARGLERLREAGPLPGACGALRPDGPAVPICPGGNRVRVERREGMRDVFEDGREDLQLVYRFDCGRGITATAELTWSVGGN